MKRTAPRIDTLEHLTQWVNAIENSRKIPLKLNSQGKQHTGIGSNFAFRDGQKEVVRMIQNDDGSGVIAMMNTGGGKTLCWQV
jgi:superfamily II DNA helicase RecQ